MVGPMGRAPDQNSRHFIARLRRKVELDPKHPETHSDVARRRYLLRHSVRAPYVPSMSPITRPRLSGNFTGDSCSESAL